jgi:hypothetical protein
MPKYPRNLYINIAHFFVSSTRLHIVPVCEVCNSDHKTGVQHTVTVGIEFFFFQERRLYQRTWRKKESSGNADRKAVLAELDNQ